MKTQLRPLSPIEREVAERNAYMISQFLAANRLPADDWWDVVVFRYLLTVKNWFARPKLYRYEFSTLAWQGMRSAVYNERKKQSRRIQAVSLKEVIPDTNGLTYAETVTAVNLAYIPYTEV